GGSPVAWMNMSSKVPFVTTPTLAVASGRQVRAPFETTISKKMCRLFCPYADPAAMSNSAELTTTVLSACGCILLYLLMMNIYGISRESAEVAFSAQPVNTASCGPSHLCTLTRKCTLVCQFAECPERVDLRRLIVVWRAAPFGALQPAGDDMPYG